MSIKTSSKRIIAGVVIAAIGMGGLIGTSAVANATTTGTSAVDLGNHPWANNGKWYGSTIPVSFDTFGPHVQCGDPSTATVLSNQNPTVLIHDYTPVTISMASFLANDHAESLDFTGSDCASNFGLTYEILDFDSQLTIKDTTTGTTLGTTQTVDLFGTPAGALYSDSLSIDVPTLAYFRSLNPDLTHSYSFTLSSDDLRMRNSATTSVVGAGDEVFLVDGGVATPPAAPVISPAPQTYSYGLGEPVTLDLSTVTAGSDLSGCTISNGDACAPDSVVFSNLPAGASIDGSGSLVRTPTSAGVFTLDMVLSQSSDGATSTLTPVTITVVPAFKVLPISQTYSATTGDPLTITLSQLEGGCIIQNSSVSCANAELNLDTLTPPTGASTDADGSGFVTAIHFTPTSAGTYAFTYRLGESKNFGFSDLVTSYVVVSDADAPTPPVVVPPTAPTVPLPLVTG